MSNSITGQLRFPDRSFDADQIDRLEEKMASKTEFRNLNGSLRIYSPSSEKGFWESKADREYSQLIVSYGTDLSFVETGSYDDLDAKEEEVIIKENTEDLFKYFIELCESTEPLVAWIHDEYHSYHENSKCLNNFEKPEWMNFISIERAPEDLEERIKEKDPFLFKKTDLGLYWVCGREITKWKDFEID